jgi:hypothetical protein
MIVSASRRTDIPAFFPGWFINRINEGFVLVRNPMNPKMVSRISLSPHIVDCIVFWTKNPHPLMDRLPELDSAGYRYYFLFSLNGYGPRLEERVPPVQQMIDSFHSLSELIGKERVVWRYDPVVFSKEIDLEFHTRHFEYLAERLCGFTEICVFSFLDLYAKCRRNLQGYDVFIPEDDTLRALAVMLANIAGKYGIAMRACAEDLERLGLMEIQPSRCIDPSLVGRITGSPILLSKDKNQRSLCGCVESVDIGSYNSCGHLCRYCYANANSAAVIKNLEKHRPDSPFLIGIAEEGDVIHPRKHTESDGIQRKLFERE